MIQDINMNKSSRIAILLVLALLTCAIADSPTGDEAGFVSIFNGKDTQGWIYGSRRGRARKFGKGYQVQDGILYSTPEDAGDMFTEKE
jgi:hypothetical protein